MSDKLIESFLKYEEQRKAQKSPNEFQNVKNLQEKVTRITASGGANTAQQDAGAGTGYTGGRQANTPVSTTTLSDFPSIENAKKIFGNAGLNPVGSIASGIGAAARSIAGRLTSSDEPRNQFPTPEAMRPTPAPASAYSGSRSIAIPAADQADRADSNQIIPARPSAPVRKRLADHDDAEITDAEKKRGAEERDMERWLSAQFRLFNPDSDPFGRRGGGREGVRAPTTIARDLATWRAMPSRGVAAAPDGRAIVNVDAKSADEPAEPRAGDTRFGNFNTDGTVSGNTSVTDARAGVSSAPTATPARPNDGNNGVSAPSQATLNTRPGLKAGPASADTIKALQSHLGITADGIAGPQTRQAVMQFQRDNDLQVDGIIGDQTRMALERSIRMRNQRNESVEFSEAELAHFKSILEAMPVAPTAEGHGPNPTPKNKAEGGKGRGSLSEKMDPVGKSDDDVNNDGKVNGADEYLRRRRNAIANNMKKKK